MCINTTRVEIFTVCVVLLLSCIQSERERERERERRIQTKGLLPLRLHIVFRSEIVI